MNIKYETRNARTGSWTALISNDGLEGLTKGTAKKLRRCIKRNNRFLMKIRPLRGNLEGLFSELNALRSISREVAFMALDIAIAHGYIEIVGYETGDSQLDSYIDSRVFDEFGIVMER